LTEIEAVQLHRGPDDQGSQLFEFGSTIVGLGQQRLSILDLSPAGNQPMLSPCGRFALAYNGEVYNYKELAAELGEDPILRISSGDTAVVLAALARWGHDALPRFNGMWALAFLDRHEGKLLVARDRLGVKPLYFTTIGGTCVMASEVKGVLAGSFGNRFKINRDVVSRFLLQSLTSATNETFFRDIAAFPPASYAEIDIGKRGAALTPRRYWHHPFEAGEPAQSTSADELRELLFDSVRLRLRSDVPVGLMLSGGLDSCSLLAAAREVAPHIDLKVLSVISRDPGANEEPYIDCMARHVGCDVIKIQTDDNPRALWNDLDDAVWHYDHPISSFSNLAHRRIMREAKDQDIIVLLTGQGADEQLAGYNKFFYFYLWHALRRKNLAGPLAMVLGSLAQRTVLAEFTLSHAKRYIPFLREQHATGWAGPAIGGGLLLETGPGESFAAREWKDMTSLSLPDLLASEDRASMAFSREMRTPFLDYRIVELLGRTPVEQKLRGGWTKRILRDAMSDRMPKGITWRRDKKGYTVPGDSWLTGELRDDVERILHEPMAIEAYGFVDRGGMKTLFKEFLAGRSGTRYEDILSVIALERWATRFDSYIEGVA
jgi:asparagine synthase (glutamine-hydrolysing)